jgi:hypothetical protein
VRVRHGLRLFEHGLISPATGIMPLAFSRINNGIKQTAETEPENFWVFNNGVTILCHKIAPKRTKSGATLSVRGMSIVNGAQTTGALGSLKKALPNTTKVLARFVETSNSEIVHDIIRFNNSQNKVACF